MLVLARKTGEAIIIGDNIELQVLEIEGDTVKIGIEAPRHIDIFRKEIYVAIQHANQEAAKTSWDPSQLGEMFRNNGQKD